ncbi:ATP-binding protein [Lentzea sp. NPDC042327]|uniref:ATP-binding protein n=1 Tax=Lentzea sp. NPDC042327 TaxID=3154801 RepID=UPI0033C3DBAE
MTEQRTAHADASRRPDEGRAKPYTSAIATANLAHQAAAGTRGESHATPGETTGEVAINTSLSCDNLSVVRERIAEALAAHDEDFVVDVQLVATELAANACDHADDPRRLVLRREEHPDRGAELVVEACDATVSRTPVVGMSSIGPYRGHGMQIVERLCTDWGVRVEDDLKIVWARLPIPA